MTSRLPGSFRDPAGHVYITDDTVYRRIEPAGRAAYDALLRSGLYDTLVADGLLVSHVDMGPQEDQPGASTVIRPERIPMISYPYEWCFSQLRDAALLLLTIQLRALDAGLTLKDASAYNVQFLRGRPVLIDTLSFEPHTPGPWRAYRQFCQHFYAPLLLMATTDARLARLSQLFLDGVPLELASRLLPATTWFTPGPLMHVHLHARAERALAGRHAGDGRAPSPRGGDARLIAGSLRAALDALRWTPRSAWTAYYAERPSYDDGSFARKEETVAAWLDRLRPRLVWDLGANTGVFSRAAVATGADVVALDSDPACVEVLYREATRAGASGLLPLVCDLTNPSPGIGWDNRERQTLAERGAPDLLLALAVLHHLCVGNHVPFAAVAGFLAGLAPRAIVEFVPPDDAMVTPMIGDRRDTFSWYTMDNFEAAFAGHFAVDARVPLPSGRVLYLFNRRA